MRTTYALALLTLAPIALAAQQAASPQPPSGPPVEISTASSIKSQYSYIRAEMTKLVEKMPAELYSYQPTPEVKTFAANVAHIAQSNIGQCGTLVGRKHELAGQDLTKTLTTKDALVAAVKSGFTFCDEFFNKLDTNAPLTSESFNSVTMRDGQRLPAKIEKGGSASSFVSHNNEMYGYMSVYLRLKGIVPPSSEKSK